MNKNIRLLLLLVFLINNSGYSQNRKIIELTNEQRAWFYNSDQWHSYLSFEVSGEFFSIRSKGEIPRIKFYDNSDFKGEAIFETYANSIYVNKPDKRRCLLTSTSKFKSFANVLKCSKFRCMASKGPVLLREYPYFDLRILDDRTNLECEYNLKFILKENDAPENDYSILIDPRIVIFNNESATVNLNGKTFFPDLRNCKNSIWTCGNIKIDESKIEIDLKNLETTKRLKNNEDLNFLIRNLLPCVKKRDRACVEKFFLQPSDVESEILPEIEGYFFNTKLLNDGIMDELLKCLDYGQLLPSGNTLKGNTKVCVISKFQMKKIPPKILNVIEPAGLMYSETHIEVGVD